MTVTNLPARRTISAAAARPAPTPRQVPRPTYRPRMSVGMFLALFLLALVGVFFAGFLLYPS